MASKTVLNAKNLESLGTERLAELLIELSTGSAAAKRRLRVALAGSQSGAEVAREVSKRLATIERSRSTITWRRIRALKADLDLQRQIIVDDVLPAEPDEALEVMWRFMGLAPSVFDRCDDSNGTIMEVFQAACQDLGMVALNAQPDPLRLAERTFSALQDNLYGAYDALISVLAPALGERGLERLKSLLVELSKAPVEPVPERERIVIGWGLAGPVYEDDVSSRHQESMIRTALKDIADAQGDVDAFIAQQNDASKTAAGVAVDIAGRLLRAGRPQEAWEAINRSESPGFLPHDWEEMRLDVLEALGRNDEAKAYRWQCFERSLDAGHLRAILKRLPDFDDLEAEEKALAHAMQYPDVHMALHFLVSWPALAKASQLVLARADEIDGDHYDVLTAASQDLAARYPLAATLLLRAMVDFALIKTRSGRYRYAARHLEMCDSLSPHVTGWAPFASHEDYVARRRAEHGKKTGFWKFVSG